MNKNLKYGVENFLLAFSLLMPILFLYILIFSLSMDSALDRFEYLKIMSYPFQGREEPLLHLISYILRVFSDNSIYNLILIQILFISLFSFTLLKVNGFNNVSELAKTFICFFIFFTIFSNMFGIQLRIGYATLIFLFIVFFLNVRPNIYSIPIFLLPCLMHSGLIPAVLIYYIFEYFKISSYKKFLIFLLCSIFISTFMISFLPFIFEIIGVSSYYYGYLDSEGDFGRNYPLTVVLYVFFVVLSLYLFRGKNIKDIHFWYGLSGIVLVYMGFVLNFYISFKMLVPISAFMYIYSVSKLNFKGLNSYIFLIFSFSLLSFSFFVFTFQVGLIK